MELKINTIYNGDTLETLKTFPDESVDCVVTSPPYYGLRDYGVAGQIGLEKTPEEYVAKMVEVFKEARRVLKKEGTLWLNLGDSYWANRSLNGQSYADNEVQRKRSGGKNHDVLKPKDLIGIPWRVAFALQQPYYSGKIKDEKDRVWMAAMLDGEGCFYIHRRKEGQHAGDGYYRQSDNYQRAFEIANTNKAIIDRCYEIAKVGSITRQDKDRRQPIYRWHVRSNEAKAIIAEIYPYLVAKQHQARLCYGIETNGEKTQAAWEGLKALHAGETCDVDYTPPPSLYEPGWYLRQDVIWSKPNPMPESVTDRCTKAHEYIFLLSKSPKYFYDAETIAEPVADSTVNRLNQPTLLHQEGSARVPDKTNGNMKAVGGTEKRNRRSVWTVTTKPYKGAHFATFPPDLIEPMIKAGCPAGGIVLDPFMGSGTTAYVARSLGRNYVGIELNPSYITLADKRLEQQVLI